MIPATVENMRKFYRKSKEVTTPDGETAIVFPNQPIAWSPMTDERYGADPGDYWNMPADEPLVDSEGEPMALVFESTQLIDADEYQA